MRYFCAAKKEKFSVRFAWTGGLATIVIAMCALFGPSDAKAAYSFTAAGLTVSENFNSMSPSSISYAAGSSWTNILSNWTMAGFNGAANTTAQGYNYRAGIPWAANATGNNGGGWRSQQANGNSGDLALGFVGNSNTRVGNATAQFTNNTSNTITQLAVTYDLTQIYAGATIANPMTVTLYYSTDGSTYTAATGTNVSWTSNIYGTTASASSNIALSVANGSSVYLRWSFTTGGVNSTGISIDNLNVTATTDGPVSENVSRGATTIFSANSFGGNAFAAIDTAVFDGTGVGVTLSGAVAAGALNFTVNGYTLSSPTSSDTIAVPLITVADGVSAEISAKITGANSLTKAGTGNLILSGSNDFVGGVTISSGTLSISSDVNLGNSANDIALNGGVLETTTSLSLGTGRDLTGSGGLSVGSGQSLTFNGTTNASITLLDTGTVAFANAATTLNGVTFAAAGTVIVSSGTLGGGITTTQTAGTATLAGNLFSGSATRTISVADGSSDVDLLISANITAPGATFSKQGTGTLELSGSNTFLHLQIGSQGFSPLDGGRVIVDSGAALGGSGGVLFANYGTLEASQDITANIGVSIGGRNNGIFTFQGSNMTFTGTGNSFFRASSATGDVRFNVNNTTEVSGSWLATSGSGSGVTLGGTGKFIISGNATAVTDTFTTQDSVTLAVNGSYGGGVSILAGTTLMGSGTIAGTADVQGNLNPGNSPGTLTVGNLVLEDSALSTFEIASGGHDAVNVASSLTYGGVLLLDITAGLNPGDVYHLFTGFTGESGDFLDVFMGGDFSFDMTNDGSGLWTFQDGATTYEFSESTGDFSVVPEPQTWAFFGMGLGAFLLYRSRRRPSCAA